MTTVTTTNCGRPESVNADVAKSIREVPIGLIKPNQLNAELYDCTPDPALLESVAREGILEPLVTTPAYVLISGERRLAAAKHGGLKSVPVEVREVAEEDMLALILSYNAQRRKTLIERLREGYVYYQIESRAAQKRMKHEPGANLPQAQGRARDLAAERVGMSARSLETGLRVLRELVRRKSSGHLEGVAEVERALDKSVSGGMKVATSFGWFGAEERSQKPEPDCWVEECVWKTFADGAGDPKLEKRMTEAFLRITRIASTTLRTGNAETDKLLAKLLLLGLTGSFENYYGEPFCGRRPQ